MQTKLINSAFWARVWNRIKHPFTVPASIITLAHQVSEKEHIQGTLYVKTIDELPHLEEVFRGVVNKMEGHFKDELKAAQAEAEAELAKKANKGN